MTDENKSVPLSDSSPEPVARGGRAGGYFRWVICALLFFATVIAYVDRGILGYLEKYLEGTANGKQIIPGLDSIQYGNIMSDFQFAYAFVFVIAGAITDKLGTKLSFALAITFWSIAAMLPGAAHSVRGLAVAMTLLGMCEAANFPVCIKTVAEWFPRAERALATGIFNSGAGIGNLLVPLVATFLAMSVGWRGAFVGAGASGFVCLALWLWLYAKPEKHPRVSASELQWILGDREDTTARVPWLRLLPVKETWAFSLGKFFTDAIWWFWVFWVPRYMQGTFHLNLMQSAAPVVTIYGLSIIGSVAAGWLPAFLLRRGSTPNFARKVSMLVCALAVVPVIYVPFSHSIWVAVGLIGLAAAAHQGWSANLFTLPSDMFPKTAVASVVGIGGMAGALGGALLQRAAGHIIEWTHSYLSLFAIACSAYLVALLLVQLLAPRLKPASFGTAAQA
ncbi:MAG: MFS transporter [Candidatus Acidiferrales bacterium]